MTKPVVTLRNTKGSALTYTELDTNFANLRDATITVSDGTNTKAIDLNGTIEFTAAGTVTIGVNPSTGAITITGTGSGTVNSGASGALAYYPSAGTTIDDTLLTYSYDSGGDSITIGSNSITAIRLGDGTGPIALDPGAGNVVSLPSGGLGANGAINISLPAAGTAISGGWNETVADSGTVNVTDGAGSIIFIHNASANSTAIYMTAGTTVATVSTSGTNLGTLAWAGGTNQFVWTNNTGSSQGMRFFVIKLQ